MPHRASAVPTTAIVASRCQAKRALTGASVPLAARELHRDRGRRVHNRRAGKETNVTDDKPVEKPIPPKPEPRCAECGGVISETDLVCPHCGISLVAG